MREGEAAALEGAAGELAWLGVADWRWRTGAPATWFDGAGWSMVACAWCGRTRGGCVACAQGAGAAAGTAVA